MNPKVDQHQKVNSTYLDRLGQTCCAALLNTFWHQSPLYAESLHSSLILCHKKRYISLLDQIAIRGTVWPIWGGKQSATKRRLSQSQIYIGMRMINGIRRCLENISWISSLPLTGQKRAWEILSVVLTRLSSYINSTFIRGRNVKPLFSFCSDPFCAPFDYYKLLKSDGDFLIQIILQWLLQRFYCALK